MLLEHFDLNNIQDIEQARRAIVMLFNLLEDLKSENGKLQEENQCLSSWEQGCKSANGMSALGRAPKRVQRPGMLL